MADYERDLLSKVIRDQDMAGFAEAKITDKFFADAEHIRVLTWMREHWKEYGASPSVQALKANYPTWRLSDTPEPLSYYVDQLRAAYRYEVLAQGVSEAAEYLEEGDAKVAQEVLQESLNDIETTVTALRDHNLTDPEAFDRLFDHYYELTENPGMMRGFPTGWPTIDLATMGLCGGQLITIVGPPKGGKSTIAQSLAEYVQRNSKVDVLMVSFEMSYDEMAARWVGIRGKLNYRRLLKGQMNKLDAKRLERTHDLLLKGETKLILSEDISSTTTVSGIIAKVQQHRPKLLVIDGVYLMDDENGEPKGSAAAITNITRSLKRIAQLFDIPVVITTQALFSKMRGQTVGAASIGYSSSFGQDSDAVIATEPREGPDGEKEHWLKILLSRSGPQVEVQIDFDWATSTFTEHAASYDVTDMDLHDAGDDSVLGDAVEVPKVRQGRRAVGSGD